MLTIPPLAWLQCVSFHRFSLNVAYFCLSLNVGKFGMDVFLTQFIFGLSEMPAHILCIWLLEALGRKISVMSTLLIGGLLCLLIIAVPQGTVFLQYGVHSFDTSRAKNCGWKCLAVSQCAALVHIQFSLICYRSCSMFIAPRHYNDMVITFCSL